MAAAAWPAYRSCTHFDVPTDALGILRVPTRTTITDNRMVNRKQVCRAPSYELEQLIEREGQTRSPPSSLSLSAAAGVVVAPNGYYPAVQEVLKKHEILFWADEVICGFGRTGNDFGSNTMSIKPDLMSLLNSCPQPIYP